MSISRSIKQLLLAEMRSWRSKKARQPEGCVSNTTIILNWLKEDDETRRQHQQKDHCPLDSCPCFTLPFGSILRAEHHQATLTFWAIHAWDEKHDYEGAGKKFEEASSQGFSTASLEWAIRLQKKSPGNDEKRAVLLLQRASQQGNTTAQFMFGTWLEKKGQHEKAFQEFREAAIMGHDEAIQAVSRCFRLGIGVEKQLTQAVIWDRLRIKG